MHRTLPDATAADHVRDAARLLDLVADAGVAPMTPDEANEALRLAARGLDRAEQAAGVTAEALGLGRMVGGLRHVD